MGVDDALVDQNWIHDVNGTGVYVRQLDGENITPVGIRITNNRIENFAGGGIGYSFGDDGFIQGNTIINGCGAGIGINEGASGNLVSGNYIDNLLQSGIYDDPNLNGAWNGIDLTGNSDDNIIENNRISRVVQCGITVEDAGSSALRSERNIVRYNHIDASTGHVVGDDDVYDVDFQLNTVRATRVAPVDRALPICIQATDGTDPDAMDTITQGNTYAWGNSGSTGGLLAWTQDDSAVYYTLAEWRAFEPTDLGLGMVQPDPDYDFTGRVANLATTGTITGLISIAIDTSSPTSPAMYGEDHYADVATGAADHVYNLPDPPVAGMSGCFYDMGEGDGGITVAVPAGDFIWLDGVKGADGVDIDSPAVDGTGGNGEFICLIAISATDWVTKGRSGAWEATD
jgi:hypothetical protein